MRCANGMQATLLALSGLGVFVAPGPAAVDYSVTFDATWSEQTHPQDFPSSPHFSGLIGATHNSSVQFWEPGSMASLGIQRMAELGSKFNLQSEVNAAITAGTAWNVISGAGIGRSPGSVSLSFAVSETHPLVTITSMLAPSPDWFVGTHGLHLRPDGYWQSEVVVDLLVYDAGTDSGTTYGSPNALSVPHQSIALQSGMPPLGGASVGTFTFRLIADPGDANGDGTLDAQDIDELSAAVREGRPDSKYDLNNDTLLTPADRVYWVETLKQISFGDADQDGDVEAASDGAVLLSNLAKPGPIGWAGGNFDGRDEIVTASGDGSLFLTNLGGQIVEDRAAVPEPSTGWLAGMAAVCLGLGWWWGVTCEQL